MALNIGSATQMGHVRGTVVVDKKPGVRVGLDFKGSRVVNVDPGSPGQLAGLWKGMCVLEVAGHPIPQSSEDDPAEAKAATTAAIVKGFGGGGQRVEIAVLSPPHLLPREVVLRPGPGEPLGMVLRGRQVKTVEPGGVAEAGGMRPGMVVQCVEDTHIREDGGEEELKAALLAAKAKGDSMRFRVIVGEEPAPPLHPKAADLGAKEEKGQEAKADQKVREFVLE
eukprot:Hpha_TRINITY_DN5292_c0_g1::TRINITY_DN5292_c0_g1_i1::g.116577::m.116577